MYGMKHYITVPTRITPTSKSCLDNIISNINPEVIISKVIDADIADHLTLFLEIKDFNILSDTSYVNKRFINERTILQFAEKLSEISWHGLEMGNYCSQEICNIIFTILCPIVDLCFSIKKIRSGDKKILWFNEELRVQRNQVFQNKSRFKKTNSLED